VLAALSRFSTLFKQPQLRRAKYRIIRRLPVEVCSKAAYGLAAPHANTHSRACFSKLRGRFLSFPQPVDLRMRFMQSEKPSQNRVQASVVKLLRQGFIDQQILPSLIIVRFGGAKLSAERHQYVKDN
jgi:hypothetical protein